MRVLGGDLVRLRVGPPFRPATAADEVLVRIAGYTAPYLLNDPRAPLAEAPARCEAAREELARVLGSGSVWARFWPADEYRPHDGPRSAPIAVADLAVIGPDYRIRDVASHMRDRGHDVSGLRVVADTLTPSSLP